MIYIIMAMPGLLTSTYSINP